MPVERPRDPDHRQGGLDSVVDTITDYAVMSQGPFPEHALRTAHLVVLDTVACALLALDEPDAVRTAKPLFPSAAEYQSRVIGTSWVADPVQATFATGTLVRWLDFNDAWLALEWGHPSDNLGAILPVADRMAREARASGRQPLTGADVLHAVVQAHEIQGVLALGTALNRQGLDHVALVRVASAAVVTRLLGGDPSQVASAVSHAWADGGALRAYRHAPNVTARKSWAAGDAAARAVHLGYVALRGEEPCRQVLTTPGWGFQDALLDGNEIELPQKLGSYIMEHILLKPQHPSEYHGQTAVEAALQLHRQVSHRADNISRIEIRTHESALRIIDKRGPLTNPADRDHSLQYMVAVALLYGELTPRHYHAPVAADPRIETLRAQMEVEEEPEYSRAYLDPTERAVANAIRIDFRDGSTTGWKEVRLPIGHPSRREEARPLVRHKLENGLTNVFSDTARAGRVTEAFNDYEQFIATPVDVLVEQACYQERFSYSDFGELFVADQRCGEGKEAGE